MTAYPPSPTVMPRPTGRCGDVVSRSNDMEGMVVMRRAFLLTATALGLVICLVGSTGLFAALTDTALTGPNQVTSPGLSASADIMLAMDEGTAGNPSCGAFSDDLTTPLFEFTASSPSNNQGHIVCVKNVGSQALTSLTFRADDLVDVDDDCTGDESLNGDTDCGAGGPGELSTVLDVYAGWDGCPYGMPSNGTPTTTLADLASTPLALSSLAVGETVCVLIFVGYPAGGAADQAIQQAQSDTVTWRFRFDAGT
jgi:hypothetical protein